MIESKYKKTSISKNQMIVLLGALIVCIVILVGLFSSAWGSVKQPIAFNHKIHAENGLECLDCHAYYKEQASSGRPTIEICSGCHEWYGPGLRRLK